MRVTGESIECEIGGESKVVFESTGKAFYLCSQNSPEPALRAAEYNTLEASI